MKNFILGLALLIAGVASAQFGVTVNAEYGFLEDDTARGIALVEYNLTGMDNFMVGPKVGFRADIDKLDFLAGATIGVQGEKMGFFVDGLYVLDDRFEGTNNVALRPHIVAPIMDSMFDITVGYSTDITVSGMDPKNNGGFIGLKYKF